MPIQANSNLRVQKAFSCVHTNGESIYNYQNGAYHRQAESKRMKKTSLLLIIALFILALFSSCDPSTPEVDDNGTSGNTTTEVQGITLVLPPMTQSDINDLQQIVIYDNGEEIKRFHADTLRTAITIAGSSQSRSTEALLTAELNVPLEVGDYNIAGTGTGYKGNGFVLPETPVTITTNGKPIKYVCSEDKTSYVYLECDAFIPIWIDDLIKLEINYYNGAAVTATMNMRNAKVSLRDIPGQATISATLSEEASKLGYSLQYEETLTIDSKEATKHKIVIKNESFKQPDKGIKITFSFDEEGNYSFFNSFATWFPLNGVDTENDETREKNSYGFVVCYVPESYTQEIYAPVNLNYGYRSSTWNRMAKNAAERHTIYRNSETDWDISTSSRQGQTAWMHVTVNPFPQKLIDGLSDLRLYYGKDSLGGWAEKYIPRNFSTTRPLKQSMPITPGDFEFSSKLTPKNGVTLEYDLIPSVQIMKTKAGYEYEITFKVINKITGEEYIP